MSRPLTSYSLLRSEIPDETTRRRVRCCLLDHAGIRGMVAIVKTARPADLFLTNSAGRDTVRLMSLDNLTVMRTTLNVNPNHRGTLR